MHRTSALTWSFLHCLTKKRLDALLEAFGTLDEALLCIGEDLLRTLGCRQDKIEATLARWEEFDVARYEEELRRRGIAFIDLEDAAYPKALKHIGDPPLFLYYQGDLSVLDQPCVALVGTRAMSGYGKRIVEAFVPPIVRAGCVTVSGMAIGVDTVVAQETLLAKGRTVAVLGHGFGQLPSEKRAFAKKIVAAGGLVLSEFPLDFTADKHTFPARNRIIAGLSLATIVCEAPAKSGALITADLALDYNRDVFCVPGAIFDPNFAGCHAMIGRGEAKLVTEAAEVLREIGIKSLDSTGEATPRYEAQSPIEAAVLKALTAMPKPAEEIVERAGVPVDDLLSTLTVLELSGAVRKEGEGWRRASG